MKTKLTIIIACVLLFLSSCKFNIDCSGVYHGYFEGCYAWPNSQGDATVTVNKTGNNTYNLLFASSGNPDFTIPYFHLVREGNVYGGEYNCTAKASNGDDYYLSYSVSDSSFYMYSQTNLSGNYLRFNGYK